jgi:hypothetical protein
MLFWKAAVFTTWIQLFTVTFELNRAFDENVALEDIVIVLDVDVFPPRRLPVTTMTFAEKYPFTTLLPVVTDPSLEASAVSALEDIIPTI